MNAMTDTAQPASHAIVELDVTTGRVAERARATNDVAVNAVSAVDAMALCMAQSAFGG